MRTHDNFENKIVKISYNCINKRSYWVLATFIFKVVMSLDDLTDD